MQRETLINFRGLLLTQDTAHLVQSLEANAGATGWQLELLGPKAGSADGEILSLAPAGRELHLTLTRKEEHDPQSALNALWGYAVPLGVTPWDRYPIVGDINYIYHFLGPWQPLYDRLLAEGRGHLAWPSVCCAAQCDVGQWKGDKPDERFAQAQLHRVGRNCGPIDGIIGPRTAESIRSLGLERSSFAQVLAHLKERETPLPSRQDRRVGHITVPGRQVAVTPTEGIKVTRTMHGASLVVDQPGRVIVDIGEPS